MKADDYSIMPYKGKQSCFKTTEDKPTGFDTGIHIIKECGEMPVIKPTIHISQIANAKKDAMMGMYPNREWLAYLQGAKVGNDWRIYDIDVPLQITTMGSVECDPDNIRPKDCIGTIHSHGKSDYKTDFSTVDEDSLIDNYHVSIVTTGHHMTGNVKIQVPCGSFMVIEAPVEVEYPAFDLTKWTNNAKKLIKDPPPVEVNTTVFKKADWLADGRYYECARCHHWFPKTELWNCSTGIICSECLGIQ
jgi:hypothetical protein